MWRGRGCCDPTNPIFTPTERAIRLCPTKSVLERTEPFKRFKTCRPFREQPVVDHPNILTFSHAMDRIDNVLVGEFIDVSHAICSSIEG